MANARPARTVQDVGRRQPSSRPRPGWRRRPSRKPAAPARPLPLEGPALDGRSASVAVFDPAAPDPELTALTHERARLVRRAVAALPGRQRVVVSRRFPTPIVALAADLQLSQRRTLTIEHDALDGLARVLVATLG